MYSIQYPQTNQSHYNIQWFLLSHIFSSLMATMVNKNTVFVLIATMLLTVAVASALYVNSVSAQMSNSTGAKNMTNATMAGNMTKKTANMTSGAFNSTTKTK
jgi:hypothetical protein